jgi:hypothetical protein
MEAVVKVGLGERQDLIRLWGKAETLFRVAERMLVRAEREAVVSEVDLGYARELALEIAGMASDLWRELEVEK